MDKSKISMSIDMQYEYFIRFAHKCKRNEIPAADNIQFSNYFRLNAYYQKNLVSLGSSYDEVKDEFLKEYNTKACEIIQFLRAALKEIAKNHNLSKEDLDFNKAVENEISKDWRVGCVIPIIENLYDKYCN